MLVYHKFSYSDDHKVRAFYGNTSFSDTPKYHMVGCIPFHPIIFPVNPRFVNDLQQISHQISDFSRKQKRWTATDFAFFPCTQWCPAKNRTGAKHPLGWGLMVLWPFFWDETTLGKAWGNVGLPRPIDPWAPLFWSTVNRPSVNQELVFQEPDPDVTNVQSSARHRPDSASAAFSRSEFCSRWSSPQTLRNLPSPCRMCYAQSTNGGQNFMRVTLYCRLRNLRWSPLFDSD